MFLCARKSSLLILCMMALLAGPAFGGIIDFVFTSQVDATSFGLTASEPLVVTFSYDPTMTPLGTSGGPPPTEGVYPLDATYQVGSYTIQAHSILTVRNGTTADIFSIDAVGYLSYGAYNTFVTGSINGTNVYGATLELLDLVAPYGMFSSVEPPATTSFASQATLVRVTIYDHGSQVKIEQTFTPGTYSFTADESGVPEPATFAYVGLGVLTLVAWRRRRV